MGLTIDIVPSLAVRFGGAPCAAEVSWTPSRLQMIFYCWHLLADRRKGKNEIVRLHRARA
jgi:hypothetical protein